MNINIVNDFICGSRVTQTVMKNNVKGCDENYISFVIIHEACSYHKLYQYICVLCIIYTLNYMQRNV